MLLGDDISTQASLTPAIRANNPAALSLAPSQNTPSSKTKDEEVSFGTTLDILHAASAALIDGMRDILLESDFENAMKVLTSWIPIQDEDLFMRIARAEWKMHLKEGKGRPR